jgi:hypothetical protein
MVFRKPVTTDCIIPSTSCHPPSHKPDSLKFFFNRIHTYPLEEDENDGETHIIRQIMENNQYNTNYKRLGNYHNNKKKGREKKYEENKTVCKQPTIDQKKLVTFTYYGKEVKCTTKLVNDTNVQIPHKTNSTLEKS